MSHAQPKLLLIVISAPSGGGKTTLCQQLLAASPQIVRAVTCTTRLPRAGEKDGIDYYFLAEAAFAARVRAGDFLEHATVFGNHYGTLKAEILNKLVQGKDVLLAIDVQGAAAVRTACKTEPGMQGALVTVFLTPPSLAILEQRLRKRRTDAPEVIQQRLSVARREIAEWTKYDYLLISTTVPEDVRRMQAIIEVEKMRTSRSELPEVESQGCDSKH